MKTYSMHVYNKKVKIIKAKDIESAIKKSIKIYGKFEDVTITDLETTQDYFIKSKFTRHIII